MGRYGLNKIIERLNDHERRIYALEQISGDQHKKTNSTAKKENYSGATGGMRLLVKNGFFKEKRSQVSIRKALADAGYHYSSQAVYGALQVLSKPTGLLVTLTEKGSKIYVERR